MTEFAKAIDAAAHLLGAEKKVEINRLAELVADQVDNVLGGGYSQYACAHAKDKSMSDSAE